jgi:hypothetical protein
VKTCSISIQHQLIDVIVELVIPVEIVKLVRENINISLFLYFIKINLFKNKKKTAIVTSCERTPCIHGQCLKIDLYTEICICENYWTGVDCSQALTSKYLNVKKEIILTKLENRFFVSSYNDYSWTYFNEKNSFDYNNKIN